MKREAAQRFIDRLVDLDKQDRGAMAALRHSLAFEPGHDPKAFPYVERFVGRDVHVDDARRRAMYASAGLFALHPLLVQERSLAAAFGELVRRRVAGGREQDKNRPSTERRFLALLEADSDGLMVHLRQAVHLLVAEKLGFDHTGLLLDLCDLLGDRTPPERRDRIRRDWAHQFYRALTADAATTAALPATDTAAP